MRSGLSVRMRSQLEAKGEPMDILNTMWMVTRKSGGWNELDEYHIVTLGGNPIGQADSEEDALLIIKAHNDAIQACWGVV